MKTEKKVSIRLTEGQAILLSQMLVDAIELRLELVDSWTLPEWAQNKNSIRQRERQLKQVKRFRQLRRVIYLQFPKDKK